MMDESILIQNYACQRIWVALHVVCDHIEISQSNTKKIKEFFLPK